ncbi:MAG TPA: hypothetical protein VGV35_16345 [Bryobacteraceae bacterium]|nr:hypothetical protein [Bryobacteraceae bacterium]
MRRCAAFLLLLCPLVFADGGRVQLRQEAGPFLITVFLASADISVLVQDRASLQPVLDAAVAIRIGDTLTRATREQAQNKLLYAATIPLEEPGRHDFTVDVKRGETLATVGGTLDIAPPAPLLASNWEYLALPPIFVVIFAIREWLIRRRINSTIAG